MNGDFTVLNEHLYGATTFRTNDRTTSTINDTIKPGEPLKKSLADGTTSVQTGNFVILFLTGDPEDGTDIFMGIAKKTSDETSSADGHVEAHLVGLGTRFRGKATTPANMDTVSELDGLLLDQVATDGITAITGNTTTTPYTIDEDEADDMDVHGLQILAGDILAGTLEVRIVAATAMMGNSVAV